MSNKHKLGDSVISIAHTDAYPWHNRIHCGEVGRIIACDNSDIPYKLEFADGTTGWRREYQVESVNATPAKKGVNVALLVGKWAHRIAPTCDSRCYSWTDSPCFIVRIDERGIAIYDENDEAGCTRYSKENPYYVCGPEWLDDQWEEWTEPTSCFNVGAHVVLVKEEVTDTGTPIPAGSTGTIIYVCSGVSGGCGVVDFDCEKNADKTSIQRRHVKFNSLALYDPAKNPMRPLWEHTKTRFDKMNEIVAALTSAIGSNNNSLGIPRCSFCLAKENGVFTSCADCDWRKVMGYHVGVTCSDDWQELCNANIHLQSVIRTILAKINRQLV